MATEIIRPTGAGTYTDLSPNGSANNWACVDEVSKSEIDYVGISNSASYGIDTYTLQNPSAIGPADTINSVTLCGYFARPLGSGYVEWGFYYKCGAVEVEKVPDSITSSTYLLKTKAYTTKNGTPWTLADLNALEAGPTLSGASSTVVSCCQFWVEIDYTAVTSGKRRTSILDI